MNFYSPYQHMIDSAAMIQENENARLFLRHSIRYDNPVNWNYDPLMLTPEGIALAKKMGACINRPIGECLSSKVKRCPQTIQSICEGMDKKFRPQIPQIKEAEELYHVLGDTSLCGWFQYFHYLQIGDLKATQGISLDMEIKRILNAIFSTRGEKGKIDLICSHDSHIIIAASALFDLKTGLDGHDWCEYAEGIFFTGERKNFTAFWRGQKKQFINYLL